MVWSELSKTSSTVACDTGLRAELPEKITSVSESPRRRLAELSPITQRTASMMFDLPQPLGPTTPVMLPDRWSVVGSTNDLKPDSLIVERRIRRSGLGRARLAWTSGRRAGATGEYSGVKATAGPPAPARRAPGARNLHHRGMVLGAAH